ncbi:unnamed protein product [Discosporangium mesarthrocarpum]
MVSTGEGSEGEVHDKAMLGIKPGDVVKTGVRELGEAQKEGPRGMDGRLLEISEECQRFEDLGRVITAVYSLRYQAAPTAISPEFPVWMSNVASLSRKDPRLSGAEHALDMLDALDGSGSGKDKSRSSVLVDKDLAHRTDPGERNQDHEEFYSDGGGGGDDGGERGIGWGFRGEVSRSGGGTYNGERLEGSGARDREGENVTGKGKEGGGEGCSGKDSVREEPKEPGDRDSETRARAGAGDGGNCAEGGVCNLTHISNDVTDGTGTGRKREERRGGMKGNPVPQGKGSYGVVEKKGEDGCPLSSTAAMKSSVAEVEERGKQSPGQRCPGHQPTLADQEGVGRWDEYSSSGAAVAREPLVRRHRGPGMFGVGVEGREERHEGRSGWGAGKANKSVEDGRGAWVGIWAQFSEAVKCILAGWAC